MKSVRKVKQSEAANDLFAFLTTEPNEKVGAIQPQAMAVKGIEPDGEIEISAFVPNLNARSSEFTESRHFLP